MKNTHLSRPLTLAALLLAPAAGASADDSGVSVDGTNSGQESFVSMAALRALTVFPTDATDSASSPASTDDVEPLPERGWPDHVGFFFRVGGMSVDPQNAARFLNGSGEVDTNTGWGSSLAIGYRPPDSLFSIELEWMYRRFDTDDYVDPDSGFLGDNRFSTHTLTANLLIEKFDIVGPVGVYAGVGIGMRLSDAEFSSSGGTSETDVSGDGFFGQIMAGITVSLDQNIQAYGGVRWSDGGTIEDDTIRLDTESVSIEAGLRFFF